MSRPTPTVPPSLLANAARYAVANDKRQEARDALRASVVRAAAQGVPETTLAKEAGVDRMTIREWLGKRKRSAVA